MKKAEIMQLLDYNIQKSIIKQQSGKEEGYYAYMLEVCLVYLRDVLAEKGVRQYRKTLQDFDGLTYYKNKSIWNLSTWRDELRLRDSMNLLREKTL